MKFEDDENARDERGYFKSGKDNPNYLHGLYTPSENLSDEDLEAIYKIVEDYKQQVDPVRDHRGDDELLRSTKMDITMLAYTEYRIAKAQGIMVESPEEFMDKVSTNEIQENLIKRRQNLRKDLGLLQDSPEARQADAQEDFFDALSEEESEDQ